MGEGVYGDGGALIPLIDCPHAESRRDLFLLLVLILTLGEVAAAIPIIGIHTHAAALSVQDALGRH